jgi:acetylornithine deacetylase/succinyl-diaminopimelate desuccinylase-like protein
MVEVLRTEMQRLGLSPEVEEFVPGRPNIYGERGGEGPRLLFMGHTDVVRAADWAERWAGQAQEDPFGATIIGNELWGRGAADLKAGICASLLALDLLGRAGVRLKGTVAYAFVGDEESGEPGMGRSEGARTYAKRAGLGELARPDFAIYVEPTRLAVFPVQMGFFIADVLVVGRSAYFGRPELGVDALKGAHRILSAVWAHSDQVAAEAEHPLLGRAFALVTGIEGGGLIAVPGEVRFSLIRKLLPGDDLERAAQELEAIIVGAAPEGIEVRIEFPAGRDHPRGGSPTELSADHPAVQRLSACLETVRPGAGGIEGAPFWSELPFLVDRIGCPAVYCAPGDIAICHTHEERVPLDAYEDAILAFALFIAEFCGTEGPPTREDQP